MKESIYVTKSFLPPLSEYMEYLEKIWQSSQLTNQGICVRELEDQMRVFLEVDNFHYLSNGTIALQLALSSLNITGGEIITTPFSYVATLSSLLWERCTPVFVDIEPNRFCIDPTKIEEAITERTCAIMPVHVFGYACDVEVIDEIAKRHSLKVIYDGAHAFGCRYKGKSLLSYGDITTCSFHATKLFHTIEGGACIVRDKEVSDLLELKKRFGHSGDLHLLLGINAKASEMHAAMGLLNFRYLERIIERRKMISELYDALLFDNIVRSKVQAGLEYNYAYYPVLFDSEEILLNVCFALNKENIFPRRYFYPSLNTLSYLPEKIHCPVSESVSSRIICLPLYPDMEHEHVEKIAEIINLNIVR